MSSPNCPCDAVALPALTIHAGLSTLPRQLATFPEFRSLMLRAIGNEPALADWRARSSDDLGIMLLEMWAYVCDCISFYDEAIANESYLRTSQLRPSLRKLVALLGYLPRPPVGARADLAILAEGRQPIALPSGTAFRSGAFPGGSPQVFELDAPSRVHPFTNKWTLARTRRATLDVPNAPIRSEGLIESSPAGREAFLVDPKSLRVSAGQIVLVEDLGNSKNTRARTVARIEDSTETDGVKYKKLTLSKTVPVTGDTLVADVRVSTPTRTAGVRGIGEFDLLYLDSLHPEIRAGEPVIVEMHGELRWYTVTVVNESLEKLPGNASPIFVTRIAPDVYLDDPPRREPGALPWDPTAFAAMQVHFGLRPAATPTVPADLTIEPGAPMNLMPPVEAPQDGTTPSRFLLEDKDSTGEDITAALNFPSRKLKPTNDLPQPLAAPVTVYGNIVRVSRGETVSGEVLGSGDASTASQTFKLKKSPLTYFPGPEGVVSTLKVYVDGLQWTEARSFFGIAPEAHVYIVRQTDNGDSLITFGDGFRGRRLPTGGNNVVAYYRYGSGKASPPAGSIHQMSKPVRGVTSVKNPVAAFGGDDAEGPDGLRTYAPRSALLLGRAISILDMEAAAASVSGVRAVRAEWRWSMPRQRPVVQIWYIGPQPIGGDVNAKLSGLSDSVTPFDAERAAAVVGTLSLAIAVEEGSIEKDVLANVRDALLNPESGILAPEHIGIGVPLFRSRIFERVLAVPGAGAVTGLSWNSKPFGQVRGRKPNYAIQPGAGKYFDFENGTLLLNGKAAGNG